jgi:hypothetical protein
MIRLSTFTLVGALAVCSFGGALGCSGTPPGTFIVVHNQVPLSDCSIPGMLTDAYRPFGVYDVSPAEGSLLRSLVGGYALFPLLQNDFPGASGDVEGNRIALSGWDVEIGVAANAEPGAITDLITSLTTTNDPLVKYSTVTSGSVGSGGGFTASMVNAFPEDLGTMIHSMGILSPTRTYWIEATVRARGTTLVQSVESQEFHYPIQLCDGCLTVDVGPCGPTPVASGACTPGQDFAPLACCEKVGELVCL